MSVHANTDGRPAVTAPFVRIKCPRCGRAATTEDKFVVQTPDGPVQRVKVGCPAGHWLVPHVESGESRWAGA
jgi:hypothetical protein